MTIDTKIGSFNIMMVDATPPPMVSLYTKAPVSSPKAKQFFEDLIKGENGIVEIVEVMTHPNKVILTLSDEISDSEKVQTIAEAFIRRVKTAVEEFDDLDIVLWEDAQSRQTNYVDTSCKENAGNVSEGNIGDEPLF